MGQCEHLNTALADSMDSLSVTTSASVRNCLVVRRRSSNKYNIDKQAQGSESGAGWLKTPNVLLVWLSGLVREIRIAWVASFRICAWRKKRNPYGRNRPNTKKTDRLLWSSPQIVIAGRKPEGLKMIPQYQAVAHIQRQEYGGFVWGVCMGACPFVLVGLGLDRI